MESVIVPPKVQPFDMAEALLYTEAEALDKTFLDPRALRRYLKLWEEMCCPLPVNSDNQKLIGHSLLKHLEATETRRHYGKEGVTERLEDVMSPQHLVEIAEDYARSSIRIRNYEEFLLNLLRVAAKIAYATATWRHFQSTMKILELEKRVTNQEQAFEKLQGWVDKTRRVVTSQQTA